MNAELAVAVSHLTFLRSREKHLLYRSVSSLAMLASLARDDIADIVGRRLKTRGWEPDRLVPRVERELRYLEQRDVWLLGFGEPTYPSMLAEIYDPPFLLFGYGEPLAGSGAMVSVVGTRSPSHEGRAGARELSRSVGRAGVPVVSGLARGIDTEAHRGALEAEAKTVAVLGCGIDTVYPAQNRMLARQIAFRGGTVISEYPPGTPPRQFNFPERNRIISGLSRACVVVEAPEHSGALITADYALEQGRELCVHAVSQNSARGAGARELSADGAAAVSSMADIAAACPGVFPVDSFGSPAGGRADRGASAANGGGAAGAGAGGVADNRGAHDAAGSEPSTAPERRIGMQLALELEAELSGDAHE